MPENDGYTPDSTTVISPSGDVQSRAVFPTDEAFKTWDRYEVLELLGEGGTARVYSAMDRALNRKVALKFLTGTDAEMEKRFTREARAQAQLDHPYVCQIYEVGVFAGRHYISMQLIEGNTLAEAARFLPLEQKILIMQQVSEAVHAAHRIGVIHRDLKPSNIMVEKTESGWHPYVLDFGLAREPAVEGVTVTGMILGTPAYMSPEQGWGELRKLDRRTDVYSLGSTLYYLITGRAPYEGNSMEILVKLAREDPQPVRKLNPQTPRDLETILSKCLERDPGRRYESAKALAEDLRRYLNGDSILARPAGLVYRLAKKTRKHKAVAAILTISVIAVAATGGAGVYTWWRAEKQVAIAQEFARTVENMEWRMRIAAMAPLHNLDQDKKQITERMKWINQRMAEAGSIAEGPGNYALGRGMMELHNFEEASSYLTKAWNAGYDTPQNSYALGLTLGQLYEQQIQAAQQIENPKQKEIKIKELEEKYRNPALTMLRKTPRTGEYSHDYVEGLIAFYEKKYSLASEKAHAATLQLRWLYEAAKLKGDIEMAIGAAEFDKGNYDAAMTRYKAAGEAYAHAIQVGRSEPSLYESECWRWLQIMILESSRGQSMKEPMSHGLAACDAALIAHPDSSLAYARKAQIWWRWADDLYYRGIYSEEAVENSIQAAQAAAQRDPNNFHTQYELGNAFSTKAEHQRASGENASESWDRSIQHYEKAAQLQSNYPPIYSNLAIALTEYARMEMSKGIDPRPKLKRALENTAKTLQLNPESLAGSNTTGTTNIILAEYEARIGVDPSATLNNAIKALQRANELSPEHPTPFMNLGTAYVDLARSKLIRGKDPRKELELAILNSEKALKLGGEAYATAYSILGAAHMIDGKWSLSQGNDGESKLMKAIDLTKKTLAGGSSEELLAYNTALDAYCALAESKLLKSQDPGRELRDAKQIQLRASKALKESDIGLWGSLIHVLEAKWQLKSGRSPEDNLIEAEHLASNYTKSAFAHSLVAQIEEVRAGWLFRTGKPVNDSVSNGIEAASLALSMNPALAEAAVVKARLYWIQAQSNKGERAKYVQLASESMQRSIEMNPTLKMKYSELYNQLH